MSAPNVTRQEAKWSPDAISLLCIIKQQLTITSSDNSGCDEGDRRNDHFV